MNAFGETRRVDTEKKNIEAIYPLSPMQQTVLVDSLMPGFDSGFLQLQCTVVGELNEDRLRRAWQHVLDTHGVLRTSLHWRDLADPLQIVRRKLELPWHAADLSELDSAEQDQAVRTYLDEDRASGLELDKAPTFRVAFFRIAPKVGRIVWSCHHALLDGWSGTLIMSAVVQAYEALEKRAELPRAAPRGYRDYIRWLSEQDPAKQTHFWRTHLEGVADAPPLPLVRNGGQATGEREFNRVKVQLDQDETRKLRQYCSDHRITVATLYQTAWAVVLFAVQREAARVRGLINRAMPLSVVFGATVSGRDIDLPGVEAMVGLFINTVPVRVGIDPQERFPGLARRLQTEQTAARRFAYVPPDQIQEAANVSPHRRLFDSLVVVENFPDIASGVDASAAGIRISGFAGGITSSYALTLVVGPGDSTDIHLVYDPDRVAEPIAGTLASAVVTLLRNVVLGEDTPIDELANGLSPGIDFSPDDAPACYSDDRQATEPASRVHDASDYEAPRSETERRVASIWRKLLGVERIGVREGFFDLGGQSVLALRLIKELEEEFKKRVPVAALFDSPTIEHIASVISGEHPDEVSTLVAMQREGDGTPVVCVHSWSGDAIFYRGIAATIGSDNPVYGLQAPGLDGEGEILDSIEGLADHHVGVILNRWPDQPVALVGRCLSGPLILEMAARIEEAGGSVAAVVNLDSGRPRGLPPRIRARYTGDDDPDPPREKDMGYFLDRIRRVRSELGVVGMIKDQVARNVVGRVVSGWQSDSAESGATEDHGELNGAQAGGGAGEDPVPEELGVLDDPRVAAVVDGLSRAWLRYEQRAYDGVLTLIRSTETASNPGKDWHVSHWERYVQDVRVHVVEGMHQTMLLEPEVAEVSRVIRMTLETTELEGSAR